MINRDFDRIDSTLAHLAQLAEALRADPDGHVRRSIDELRAAFESRAPIEPAVARVLRSVELLDAANHGGCRREFMRRAMGLDHLIVAVNEELLPNLRRMGFEV